MLAVLDQLILNHPDGHKGGSRNGRRDRSTGRRGWPSRLVSLLIFLWPGRVIFCTFFGWWETLPKPSKRPDPGVWSRILKGPSKSEPESDQEPFKNPPLNTSGTLPKHLLLPGECWRLGHSGNAAVRERARPLPDQCPTNARSQGGNSGGGNRDRASGQGC